MSAWLVILSANSFAIALSIALSRFLDYFSGVEQTNAPIHKRAVYTGVSFVMSFAGALLAYCGIFMASGYLPMSRARP